MSKSGHSDYYEVIEKIFHFLLSDFGFSIEEPFEDYVELKSNNCIVVVLTRNSQCNVSIGPLGTTSDFLKSKNLKPVKIDVDVILKKFAPHENFEKNYSIFTIEDIAVEVGRNVNLMKKYCMKLLEGDFAEWERVRR